MSRPLEDHAAARIHNHMDEFDDRSVTETPDRDLLVGNYRARGANTGRMDLDESWAGRSFEGTS